MDINKEEENAPLKLRFPTKSLAQWINGRHLDFKSGSSDFREIKKKKKDELLPKYGLYDHWMGWQQNLKPLSDNVK